MTHPLRLDACTPDFLPAPRFKGLERIGDIMLLSTITSAPCSCAILDISRMSEIICRGFVGLSSHTILVLGPTAALTASKSPVSIRLKKNFASS